MTLDDELGLSYYSRVTPLNEKHGVWLVRHKVSGCFFVLKELSVYNREVFSRLMREPVPGVPRVYGVYESDGVLTVIEQFINGRTLRNILDEQGKLTRSEALHVAKQTALILCRLHSLEPPVIHRDVKPSNIMITGKGTVALIDYDAAKYYNAEAESDTECIGTNGYAAPEQYGFKAVSPETDIYALGVVLSEMLTGDRKKKYDEDDAIASVIKKCTKMDSGDRFPSAAALLKALNAAGGPPVSLKDGSRDRQERSAASRFRPIGFRSLTPWKMLLAALCYGALIAYCVSIRPEDGYRGEMLLFRILMFVGSMLTVLFASNYGGIHEPLGISRIKNKAARIAVTATISFLIFIVFIIIIGIVAPSTVGRTEP